MFAVKLRNLEECPPLTPAAQLLHHAVSDLASLPDYGYDGVAYRGMRMPPELVAMRLPPELVAKYL